MSILASPSSPVVDSWPDVYHDESPVLPETAYEPTEEDSRWWAEEAVHEESGLDWWLANAAPECEEEWTASMEAML